MRPPRRVPLTPVLARPAACPLSPTRPPGNRSLSVDSRSPAPAGSPLYFCLGSSEDSRHVFPSRPGLCSKQRSRRSTTHSPRSSPKDRDGVSAAELCSRRSGRIGKAPMSTSSCRRTAASRLWTPRWNPRFTNGMSALGASRIEVQDRSLKFSFPMGRIEITQLDPTPNLPPELAVVEGREIAAYSNGQILTGKLYGRGEAIAPAGHLRYRGGPARRPERPAHRRQLPRRQPLHGNHPQHPNGRGNLWNL